MPKATRRAVFEVGMNHAGEIVPLSKMIAPHVVAVTTVGPVHTENFADGEAGVARAKAEIFAGLEPGGVAVLNADNRWFSLLKTAAEQAGATIVTFGAAKECDAQLLDFVSTDTGARVALRLRGEPLDFPIRQTGFHWGLNSLAVLLMPRQWASGYARPLWRPWPTSPRSTVAARSGPSPFPAAPSR